MTDWKRARTDQQKTERFQEIYDVARKQLSIQSFDSITLTSIAKELSFSRTNLYKYFQSKEDLYLSLMGKEVERFANDLSHRLQNIENDSVSNFLLVWIPTFVEAKTLRILLSITGTILEKNCSDFILIQAKKNMMKVLMNKTIPAMHRVLSSYSQQDCIELHETLVLIGNGVVSFCGLSVHQQQVLQENGLEWFMTDFDTEYRRILSRFFPVPD
jgi:AcrR family transcriptional regulator